MPATFATVTVIGAGTMGAAIAAQFANAGLTVYLLDLAKTALSPKEIADGLTLELPNVRSQPAHDGFARMVAARPAHLFTQSVAERIHLGNLTDDLAAAADRSDWIIEAIVEQLAPKQALMAQLERLAPPHAIISTNTSGLPIVQIGEGRAPEFRQRLLGTHFFNPPRYLPLLEVIPTADTDPAILRQVVEFATRSLGKEVVICHDTPNFIANRIVSYILATTIAFAVRNGYTVAEVDALTGPLLGRPRSGTFRLNDIVGIDVWAMIAQNLHALIPHDADRAGLVDPDYQTVMATLIAQGYLGTKTNQGFYQTLTAADGSREFWGLDLAAARQGRVVYRPSVEPTWPTVEAVRRQPLPERIRALLTANDRVSAFIWHTLSRTMAYAAARLPEIADSPADIDNVMRLGFGWEMGPFALWDALGVPEIAARMQQDGLQLPAWVTTLLAQGHTKFYTTVKDRPSIYLPQHAAYQPLPTDTDQLTVASIRAQQPTLAGNEAASLHNLGDGLLLLEVHTKANTLDRATFAIVDAALERLQGSATGLLIANDGNHFSAGANLRAMLAAAEAGAWDEIEAFIRIGQRSLLALRHAAKPVVAAPFQRALGGGAEVCLAAHRVVAHAETYLGLVEFQVGLLPGWGGCKELVRRHVREEAPATGLMHIFSLITQGKVSSSALDAQALGLLASTDSIIMHRGHLLSQARRQLLQMTDRFTPPVITAGVFAAGAAARAVLDEAIASHQVAGRFSAHDAFIANTLVHVLVGGDATGWCDETAWLDLECDAFLRLIGTPASQARMAYMLAHGKPLRN